MQTLIILAQSFSSNSLHTLPLNLHHYFHCPLKHLSIIRPSQILSQRRQIIKHIHPSGFENELNSWVSKMQSTRINHLTPTYYLHELNRDLTSTFLWHPTEQNMAPWWINWMNSVTCQTLVGTEIIETSKSWASKRLKSSINKKFLFVGKYNHLEKPWENSYCNKFWVQCSDDLETIRPLPGIPKSSGSWGSNKYLYNYVHNNITHKAKKVQATRASIKGLMDKQNVVHTYRMKQYSALKRKDIDTCYNMNGSGRCYAKWNKPVTKGQMLYDSASIRFQE